jgi:hypothetical protein
MDGVFRSGHLASSPQLLLRQLQLQHLRARQQQVAGPRARAPRALCRLGGHDHSSVCQQRLEALPSGHQPGQLVRQAALLDIPDKTTDYDNRRCAVRVRLRQFCCVCSLACRFH